MTSRLLLQYDGGPFAGWAVPRCTSSHLSYVRMKSLPRCVVAMRCSITSAPNNAVRSRNCDR